MKNKKYLIFFLILITTVNCSFDSKTGIWGGSEDEKKRITELEKNQKNISVEKIYSSDNVYIKEIKLIKKINLTDPKNNFSWNMPSLNYQNFLGNIYFTGLNNKFLKKKIGRNKFSSKKITSSPIVFKNKIILSDDRGSIFNINESGKINWKKNIYKKSYKRIFKNLTFGIYKNNIYVADNVGFIYAIALDSGKILWIKNHGVPLKSKIKIFDDKVFLVNQDNRLISLSIKDGSIIWDVRAITSFIKSQNFLSLAFSKNGDLIASNSSGDLIKIDSISGQVYWSINTLESTLAHAADFFKSSDIVIINENIIFSTQSSIFSFSLDNGYVNWETKVSSTATPIINGKNIFLVTENGYFVIMNMDSGKIISSTNILNILKRKKRSTRITGFIMGSGKIYAVTLNGYLIVSSATTGKAESFKKIGSLITSTPIISDGKLFIYTHGSRILGFN